MSAMKEIREKMMEHLSMVTIFSTAQMRDFLLEQGYTYNKDYNVREHLCTPSACPSLRSVILTLTIQFPSFASGKCQLSSQQRSKARMPV